MDFIIKETVFLLIGLDIKMTMELEHRCYCPCHDLDETDDACCEDCKD